MALSRIMVGALLITPTIIGLFVPGFEPLMFLIAAVFIAIGTGEYYWMAIRRGYSPHYITGIIGALALFALGVWLYGRTHRMDEWIMCWAAFGVIVVAVHLVLRGYYDAIADVAVTMIGPLYVSVPITLAVLIWYYDQTLGRLWILYLFLVVWITDTGAYVVGKNFGRRRMSPLISPKKTWEGALGGLLVPIPMAVGFWMFSSPFRKATGLLDLLLLTLGLCLIAIIADLGESAFKRDAGQKDSGTLFKEMGGALDIIDSFLFCAPALYVYHHFLNN
ncbi:MAG: phosphatidate cytidylyltransferase [Candidatus Sumerlaeia bacterium]